MDTLAYNFCPNPDLVQCAMVQCANDRANRVPGVALHGLRPGVAEQGRKDGKAEEMPKPEVPKDGDMGWAPFEEYIERIARRMGEGFDAA